MKYENPLIPEGINTSKTHPLKTFLILVAGLLAILIISAWLLGAGGGYLASKIPYSQEKRLAQAYSEEAAPRTEILDYLQTLADKVSAAMQLAPEMKITVHYVAEDVENAFATIGGNIFLYKGLLEKLPNENALAMLIGHEIGHVRHRDPIVSIGQNAAISTGMMLLLGSTDTGILGSTGLLTQMQFSRDMESRSDETGLIAVEQLYGHVSGVLDLYRVLDSISEASPLDPPQFFSTHPISETRINELSELIVEMGWKEKAAVTPFPKQFSTWLSDS